MNQLVASNAEDLRSEDLFGVAVNEDLDEAVGLTALLGAADILISRLPTRTLRPESRACCSVKPVRDAGRWLSRKPPLMHRQRHLSRFYIL